MRKPNYRELKVLRNFIGLNIESPGAFPGAGHKTFSDMVAMDWIVWVESPETNEQGYRITEKGKRAKDI